MPRMTTPGSVAAPPLFDNLDLISPAPMQAPGVVRFVGHEDCLSKEEKAFNRLTARIKNLQARIEKAEQEDLELNQYYVGKFGPALESLGQAMVALAFKIEETATRMSSTKTWNRKLKQVIPPLLQKAFQMIDPAPEAMVLHDKYSTCDYESIQQAEDAEEGEAILNLMAAFGFDIPPEIRANPANPDAIEAFMADQITHKLAEDAPASAGPVPRPRKKTKKQLEKEVREKQKDDLKQRSLREIYLALAKVLHPDVELDPGLKQQKETFLKRVTSAYSEGNLVELLRLEMEWVDEVGFQGASKDKLLLYLEILKDQVRELESTCFRIEHKFRDTYAVPLGSLRAFRKELAEDKTELEIQKGWHERCTSRLEREPGFLEVCLNTLRKDF